jgi:hypothetical protein
MTGASAVNPLVAFYDIIGREVQFLYFVPDTSPDWTDYRKKLSLDGSGGKLATKWFDNTNIVSLIVHLRGPCLAGNVALSWRGSVLDSRFIAPQNLLCIKLSR